MHIHRQPLAFMTQRSCQLDGAQLPMHDHVFAEYGLFDDFPDNLPEEAIVDFCEDILKLDKMQSQFRVLNFMGTTEAVGVGKTL